MGATESVAASADWARHIGKVLTASLSDLNPLRRDEPFLSIDIGSNSIKIVEIRRRGGHLRVTNALRSPTPASAIQNNMVNDVTAVADALRSLKERHGLRANKVIAAVPGPAVIIKRVTLPAQKVQELENTILFEAGNFIPEDLENVNLDYQVTDYLEDGKRIEVLLVAAKKDIVISYSQTLRAAGLTPVIVDVDYFALENMFESNYEVPLAGVVALVNIGARYSSINILKGGRSAFTGDVPVGGRDITEALVRNLNVNPDEAEVLKITGNLPADQVLAVSGPALTAVIEEIHHALSFFWTAATDEPIDKVYLSGGVARMEDLAQQLSDRVQAPVEIANPFARASIDRHLDTPQLRQQAPEFAVAMGLASRQPNDK